ncbi:MAG: DUF1570 domain-containing protein [Gemmataceae bacterium]|nr:DUF1570 domain-containing protein [Gemmataceae bacterium]
MLVCLLLVAAPPGQTAWPFDEVTLKNGATFRGLILDDRPVRPGDVRFQTVRRPPGRPTVTLTTTFAEPEIAGVKRLADKDRAVLKERLAELDAGGGGELKRAETLALAPARWLDRPAGGFRYDSDYFTLEAGTSAEVARRAAVRLEQIYAAFARFLPPAEPGRPTVIRLAPDRADYRALLVPLGQPDLLNPAVYDPRTNQIVCGSDLRALGEELQRARFDHSQQLVRLDRYEEQVRKLYRQPELDRYLEVVRGERRKVWVADAANGAKFDEASRRLFALLYHEAFHAYAGTFVYPPLPPDRVKEGRGTGELPRWLNEGLAQVFETAVVEAGELRADRPDRDRLNRAKDRLRGKVPGGLVPLTELLVCGPEAFVAHHAADAAAADRAYLSCWALAYYLTFERRVIGTAKFRAYLVEVNTGIDPRGAFERLVGKDLPAFEAEWHGFVPRMQSDGTVLPAGK